MGTLTLVSNVAETTAIDLTATGVTDWVFCFFNRKATGGTKIRLTSSPSSSGDSRLFSWTDGTPTASNTDAAIIEEGAGVAGVVDVGTSPQTVILYVASGGAGTLSLSLSDSSASPLTITDAGTHSTITVTVASDSAGQTLIWQRSTFAGLSAITLAPAAGGGLTAWGWEPSSPVVQARRADARGVAGEPLPAARKLVAWGTDLPAMQRPRPPSRGSAGEPLPAPTVAAAGTLADAASSLPTRARPLRVDQAQAFSAPGSAWAPPPPVSSPTAVRARPPAETTGTPAMFPFTPWGYEPAAPVTKSPRADLRGSSGEPIPVMFPFTAWGYEPPSPATRSRQADRRPIGGEPLPPVIFVPWGYEPPSPVTTSRAADRRLANGEPLPVYYFTAWGWEPVPPTTKSPSADRRGVSGEPVPLLLFPPSGFDPWWPSSKPSQANRGGWLADFFPAAKALIAWGWEPPSPVTRSRAADERGVSGEPLRSPSSAPPPAWGYEPASPVTRSPAADRRAWSGEPLPAAKPLTAWGFDPAPAGRGRLFPIVVVPSADPAFGGVDWAPDLAGVVARSSRSAIVGPAEALPSVAVSVTPWSPDLPAAVARAARKVVVAGSDVSVVLAVTNWVPDARWERGPAGRVVVVPASDVFVAPTAFGFDPNRDERPRRRAIVGADGLPLSGRVPVVVEVTPGDVRGARPPSRPAESAQGQPAPFKPFAAIFYADHVVIPPMARTAHVIDGEHFVPAILRPPLFLKVIAHIGQRLRAIGILQPTRSKKNGST